MFLGVVFREEGHKRPLPFWETMDWSGIGPNVGGESSPPSSPLAAPEEEDVKGAVMSGQIAAIVTSAASSTSMRVRKGFKGRSDSHARQTALQGTTTSTAVAGPVSYWN